MIRMGTCGPEDDTAEEAQPAPSAPMAKAAPSWSDRFWEVLETGGKRVGIPAFIVSSVALGFVIANYRLTVASNRPFLASYGMEVSFDPRSARAQIGFNNVGKVIARRGILTLYSLERVDAADPVKLISIPIIGAGPNIFVGAGSNATFDPHLTDGVRYLLACASYFDDAGTRYEQAFMFQRNISTTVTSASVPYTELEAPDLARCAKAQAS
ncbi:hypothetical protein ACWAUC_29355 [Bradyrhizobium guangdongense]